MIQSNFLYKLCQGEWKVILSQKITPCHDVLLLWSAFRYWKRISLLIICTEHIRLNWEVTWIAKLPRLQSSHLCIHAECCHKCKRGDGKNWLPRTTPHKETLHHIPVCVSVFTKADYTLFLVLPLKQYWMSYWRSTSCHIDPYRKFWVTKASNPDKMWTNIMRQHGIRLILTAIRRPHWGNCSAYTATENIINCLITWISSKNQLTTVTIWW